LISGRWQREDFGIYPARTVQESSDPNGEIATKVEQMSPRPGSASMIVGRLDRISVWSLPGIFIGVIGLGFLFTFYDIFDINVSFIQTCMQIVPGCTPESSAESLGLPVLLNLVGYVIGALVLSPLADRFGRRDVLLATMLITGLGSLLNAFVGSYVWFVVARTITGIGIGADLAIVNTYIGEMAPRHERAKYTSLIFLFSAVGALIGVWLGLLLTTPPAPFPLGLPVALASRNFAWGWRLMYAIGGALALIGLLLRFRLPESPRWLVAHGHTAKAETVLAAMERRAERHGSLAPVKETLPIAATSIAATSDLLGYAAILTSPEYRRRSMILLAMWFFGYITIYAFAAGFTSVLAALGYAPPEAGLVTAIAVFGFVLCAWTAYGYGERMERGSWLIAASVLTLLGSLIVGLAGNSMGLSVIGALIAFYGFNLWVPIAYAWSAESYPTRARTTGFAIVDGVGHLGGGVGLLFIAPLIPTLGALGALLLISGFLVLGAAIAQLGIRTRGRILDEVSP
jgi:MFS family permease